MIKISYLQFKLINDDISFDEDNKLIMIEDIAQEFKILLETQYSSDYRDPSYGLKLQELMQSNYDKPDDLISLYVTEAINQHPRTDRIESLTITKSNTGRQYTVNVTVILKSEEIITVGSEISV